MVRLAQMIFLAALLTLPGLADAAFISFGVNGGGGGGGGGDPTSNVLPAYNDAYTHWQNAGLQSVGGIPTRTTQCGATLSPSGITPPATGDDASRINAAIQACTGGVGSAGQVVKLAAGTFQISMSEFIYIDRGITLRGTGACTQTSSTTNALAQYCQTIINVYDGALPYVNGGECGVDASHVVACWTDPAIYIGPANTGAPSDFVNSWSTCGRDTTLTTGCTPHLAADAAAGQTTVQVTATSAFSVGMWVMIDEDPQTVTTANPYNDEGASYPTIQASADLLSSSGSPVTMRLAGGDEPCDYSFCNNRVDEEIHLITAKGPGPCPGVNCTLTFDDPLTMAFRQSSSHSGNVYWPGDQNGTPTSFVAYAGVENLSVSRAVAGGINMVMCAYCWVNNVEVSAWFAGAVNMEWTVRSQVDANYLHDCYDCENNGAEYPIGISQASTEDYVVNNIVIRGGKGMVGRAANTAVVAYNYVDETFYQTVPNMIGDYWMDMALNGSHYAGTHHFLFEGNWGDNCDNDNTHGNAIYHTYFRNQCTGLRTAFADPSYPGHTEDDFNDVGFSGTSGSIQPASPGFLRTAGPMGWDYWMAYVGNVLGFSAKTTTGHGWAYSGKYSGNKFIWALGWNSDATCTTCSDAHLDGTIASYIFRHGDYDYVNGSIVDWTATYSHTLPNSFFLNAQPSFFTGVSCAYPWPWVTPTAGSPLQSASGPGGCSTTSGLPAKARFDAGTPFVQP